MYWSVYDRLVLKIWFRNVLRMLTSHYDWSWDRFITKCDWLIILGKLDLQGLLHQNWGLNEFEGLSCGLVMVYWRGLHRFGWSLGEFNPAKLLKDVFDLLFLHFADHEAWKCSIRAIIFSENFLSAGNARSLMQQIISGYHSNLRLSWNGGLKWRNLMFFFLRGRLYNRYRNFFGNRSWCS